MKASLSESVVKAADEELRRAGVDGWLLYDLEARNRVAAELLSLPDGLSRRWFVLLRPGGKPRALAHRIELSHWDAWPHPLEAYMGWQEMQDALAELLHGCETVAMEVSERDAVPFLDNVPAGVVELVESLGVRVVSSAPLVSGTYAQWGDEGRRLHARAAAALARIAREAFGLACRSLGGRPAGSGSVGDPDAGIPAPSGSAAPSGSSAPSGTPSAATEHDLAEWIRSRLAEAGLAEGDTIVAVGPNSALPHYFPGPAESAPLEAERVLLIDLWGKIAGEPRAVFADQTWMGYLGPDLPEDVARAWAAVREARDAGVEHIRAGEVGKGKGERGGRGEAGENGFPTGAEVDLAVRSVLEAHGFGEAIYHRTGHAMDRVNHGFGPNLDAVETRDDRRLVPGIGFSVEPGLYFEGRFGLRSEINVYLTASGPEVSPPEIQRALWRMEPPS